MSAIALHVDQRGSGLPVVLLHAFPLSSAMYAGQRDGLADGCRVLTPDLRGFGGSPPGGDPPSLDHMADDVATLLDGLGLDTVVLGGLSMGGYVAMSFLRRHPGRVRALVLADTKATADPEPARDNRLRIADRLDADGAPDVLLHDVLPGLCGETTQRNRPEVLARVTSLVAEVPPPAAAWAQRAMAARPDSLGTLRGVAVPALVVVGDEDRLASRDDAAAMVDALPRGQLVVLPGAGHLSAVETPGAFNQAVRSFVGSVG